MEFYEFSQNNSGGVFITDDKLCHQLFIEAEDAKESIYLAERLGCYWDGVEMGCDCSCCGDRWYRSYVKPLEFPMEWGKSTLSNIEEYAQYMADNYGWTTPDCRIFYKDGTVKEIFTNKENSVWGKK
jgi:hypothetical protein